MLNGRKLAEKRYRYLRNLVQNAELPPKETEVACIWYAQEQDVVIIGAGCVKRNGLENVWVIIGSDKNFGRKLHIDLVLICTMIYKMYI